MRHKRFDVQKLRALEAENAKLKRIVADSTLAKLALLDAISKIIKRVEKHELVAQLQMAH